jgi:hypothetical protein
MLRKEEILEILRDWNYWDKDVENVLKKWWKKSKAQASNHKQNQLSTFF